MTQSIITQDKSKVSTLKKEKAEYRDFKNLKNAALYVVNRGIARVFPCKPDKTPYVNWKDVGFTTREQIDEWCEKHPETLWAIHLNQGFSAIDFDTYNPKFNEIGLKLLHMCKKRCEAYHVHSMEDGISFLKVP